MRRTSSFALTLALAASCNNEPSRFTPAPMDAGRDGPVLPAVDVTFVTEDRQPCRAGIVYCRGDTSYRCDENGDVIDEQACMAPTSVCVQGRGCLACPPGTSRCDPSMPQRVQSCRSDGSGYDNGPLCDTANGDTCNAGSCVGRCSESALGNSYVGCDYWPTVTPNAGLNPSFQFAVVLANPQTYPVRVNISGGALANPATVDLAPGAIQEVVLPWVIDLVQLNPNCVPIGEFCVPWTPANSVLRRGGAYHIHSNGPITAYQFNPLTFSRPNGVYSYTNDASLLLPQGVLTRRYTVLSWPNFPLQKGMFFFGGFASVVAVTGEITQVTVRASSTIRAGTGVMAMRAGESRTFSLQPGDVLQLVGEGRGDITGTTIESTQPVAVYVGHDCTNVPLETPACDHLEEQLLPNEAWGREYVVSGLRDRGATQASLTRIVSRVANNRVTFDPPDVHAEVTLGEGQVLEFQTPRHFVVRGTGAFLAMQFMIGQGYDRSLAGDPAMVTEVPVEQYRTSYEFSVPASYVSNFINVVTTGTDPLEMDGMPLRGSSTTVGRFTVFTLPIQPGAHRLRSPTGQPLGLKVYGVAPYTSYMYPGGLDLRRITPG